MNFAYAKNKFSREFALTGDVLVFNTNNVECTAAPAGSALDPTAPDAQAAGGEVLLDRPGVYTFVVGKEGSKGWERVFVRAMDPAIEQWPRLIAQVNGLSCARRVFREVWLQLCDSVTWSDGTGAKNPSPTNAKGECIDLMSFGAPKQSDTMAEEGARRHDSSIDGRIGLEHQ